MTYYTVFETIADQEVITVSPATGTVYRWRHGLKEFEYIGASGETLVRGDLIVRSAAEWGMEYWYVAPEGELEHPFVSGGEGFSEDYCQALTPEGPAIRCFAASKFHRH